MTESTVGERIAEALGRADIQAFRKAVIEWLLDTGLTAAEGDALCTEKTAQLSTAKENEAKGGD